MATPSRSAQFAKVHKVLKKHYKPVVPDTSRPVLTQLLFASLLEDAPYDAAGDALAALESNFYDWNEVRVSTVRELAEVLDRLPDPMAAASRIKRVLQSVFETNYAFDLEDLRKLNLGPATDKLAKCDGVTPFTVACVVQSALGGHSIPIDSGAAQVLWIADVISAEDAKAGVVHGLERAIAKNKGAEFGSLLHQLAADFVANPFAAKVREILIEISPTAAERLPKRRAKKDEAATAKEKGPSDKRAAEHRPKAAAPAAEPPAAVPPSKAGRPRKDPAADGAAPPAEAKPPADGARAGESKGAARKREKRPSEAPRAAPQPRKTSASPRRKPR